ncbi:hypothetical protein IV203_032287 [Nitzschia inconspicua]|uniref:Uncharacterized protein n=1 Tax=Nitzschia inconspicua TaxID=303405 RepID=A0A9K3PFA3_9STRA|nr:hypothetical protein IV203_032287 [Nitzschia inconspicua]
MRARDVNNYIINNKTMLLYGRPSNDCQSDRPSRQEDAARSKSKRTKSTNYRFCCSTNIISIRRVLVALIGWQTIVMMSRIRMYAEEENPQLLVAEDSSVNNNVSVPKQQQQQQQQQQQHPCPPNSGGLIVLNILGLLGNNFFEIGFANILARELCWDVVYRPMWNQYFFKNTKATQCFPNALLPTPTEPKEEWKTSLRIQDSSSSSSSSFWKQLTYTETEDYNEQILEWVGNLTNSNNTATDTSNVLRFEHLYVDLPGDQMRQLIHQVGYPQENNNRVRGASATTETTTFAGTSIPLTTNPKRLLFLEAFFIQYDWVAPYLDDMRYWFAFNPSCCRTPPPPDKTVVIHVRNHEQGFGNYQLNVYKDILKQYGYDQTYNLWIICQPEYKEDQLMKDFLAEYGNDRVRIETGVDEVDAVCIMKHAPVLIVSSGSTFSMMAALLAEPSLGQVVHYPVERLEYPEVTIKVPTWKYHLVDHPSNAKVLEFDFDQDRMRVKMS